MQASEKNRVVKSNRRRVQASTTLSRKYTKRPAQNMEAMEQTAGISNTMPEMEPVAMSPMVQHFNSPMPESNIMQNTMPTETVTEVAQQHPMQATANAKMQERKMAQSGETQNEQKMSAKELKDQAIKKALATAAMSDNTKKGNMKEKSKMKKAGQMHFGFGRVMLALGCAAAAVFAIVYFVNLNMPDISMRVAAMQTGINPSYPNYVPRGYSVSSITSEEEKITLSFSNSETNENFTIIEENSSWDSNALLSNFVKEEYGENYTIVREQGLTIYVNGSNATWVNGGTLYKINAPAGTLTNKQIRSIAVSL